MDSSLPQSLPSSFTVTETTQDASKGKYKQPLGYRWQSTQAINSADKKCWRFTWDYKMVEFIAFTLHYEEFGSTDIKVGERIAIYHKPTGVLLKVSPLSSADDEQIATVTKTLTIDIQYTDPSKSASYKFSEAFNIPSAYTETIS